MNVARVAGADTSMDGIWIPGSFAFLLPFDLV